MSFAARLLEWLLAPLLFLWLLSLGITFLAARETVDTALDDQLNLAAEMLRAEWLDQRADGGVTPFPSPTLRRVLFNHNDYPMHFVIAERGKRAVAGDDALLPLLRETAGDRPIAMIPSTPIAPGQGINSVLDEEFVRVARFHFDLAGVDHYLVVAQSRARQDRLLRSILFYEAIPQSAVIVIAVYLVWYGLAYVVRPMRKLKTHLDGRGVNNLSPLPPQLAPSELSPLIQSINDLISRLQVAHAAQKRFIANAAHQLRTPLAALRAHGELLKQRSAGDARDAQTIEQLLTTSTRANRLAKQLLSLLRAETSATTASFETIDLNVLAREVCAELLPLAIERNIDFSFEECSVASSVYGDSTLITEMIFNLVDNALKYTPRSGHVLLSVDHSPSRLSVEDSGPGVSEADRERIFSPFARVPRYDAETHHVIAGSGLGLAIVLEVVRSHGARIDVGQSRWNGARMNVVFV